MHAIQEPLPLLEAGRAPDVDEDARACEPMAVVLDERMEPPGDDDSLLGLATLSRGELRGLFR